MKNILVYFFLISLLLGCENTKERIPDNQQVSSEQVNPDIPENSMPQPDDEENEEEEEPEKQKYPKITNENVVEFLTNYGKENPETKVLLKTKKGDIEIELYKDTPLHRANFIYLVKQGYFDKTFFHRVVPDFIIQGGNSDLVSTQRKRSELGKDYLLPAEIIRGRIHEYGTVSGAKEYRDNPDHRTAPYEFFIFLGPSSSATHLNGSYTIFGRVSKGMDVVKIISELETDNSEWPIDNIFITAEVLSSN